MASRPVGRGLMNSSYHSLSSSCLYGVGRQGSGGSERAGGGWSEARHEDLARGWNEEPISGYSPPVSRSTCRCSRHTCHYGSRSASRVSCLCLRFTWQVARVPVPVKQVARGGSPWSGGTEQESGWLGTRVPLPGSDAEGAGTRRPGPPPHRTIRPTRHLRARAREAEPQRVAPLAAGTGTKN